MNKDQGRIGLAAGSWLVAAIVGVLAVLLLWVLAGWSFLQGAFIGLVAFVVSGLIISWIMTRPLPEPVSFAAEAPAAKTPEPETIQPTEPVEVETQAKLEPTAPKSSGKAPSAKPVASDGQPEVLSAPRDGLADDLKKITGVGPKLEQTLNGLGIWHFDQIAALRKKEIAWVDERLRFKGRIERDDWVKQAKKFAKEA